MVAAGLTDCAKTPRQPATLEKRPPQFRYGAFSLAARGPRTLFSFFQNAISEFSHSLSRRRLPTHAPAPRWRNGSLSENSPQKLRLTGRDGISIWVALSRNRLNYEIQ